MRKRRSKKEEVNPPPPKKKQLVKYYSQQSFLFRDTVTPLSRWRYFACNAKHAWRGRKGGGIEHPTSHVKLFFFLSYIAKLERYASDPRNKIMDQRIPIFFLFCVYLNYALIA